MTHMSDIEMVRLINSARLMAIVAHSGQKYGEDDYFTHHVEAVVDKLSEHLGGKKLGEETAKFYLNCVIAAYLHDVIEDSYVYTLQDIEDRFGYEIRESVSLITKKEGVTYEEYIEGICSNYVAWIVKVADTRVNLEKSINTYQKKRVLKYTKQLKDLYEGIEHFRNKGDKE